MAFLRSMIYNTNVPNNGSGKFDDTMMMMMGDTIDVLSSVSIVRRAAVSACIWEV